jgi:hypothetical protein
MILPHWISGQLRESRTPNPFRIPPLHADTISSLVFLLVPRARPITVYLKNFIPSLFVPFDLWASASDEAPLGSNQAP